MRAIQVSLIYSYSLDTFTFSHRLTRSHFWLTLMSILNSNSHCNKKRKEKDAFSYYEKHACSWEK